MTSLDAMKQALDAIEHSTEYRMGVPGYETLGANLRVAIAEMEKAEPVAWDVSGCLYRTKIPPMTHEQAERWVYTPLYAHPAQSRDSIIEACANVDEHSAYCGTHRV